MLSAAAAQPQVSPCIPLRPLREYYPTWVWSPWRSTRLKKANPISDPPAVVTGIILAMNVPVGMPIGQLIIGDLVVSSATR